MPYTKRIFRPGINREGTAYDNEDGWFDCNLIRFRNGHVEKMSGWEKLSSNTYLGTSRALHNWMSLGSNLYLGIGTTNPSYGLHVTNGVNGYSAGFNESVIIGNGTTPSNLRFANVTGAYNTFQQGSRIFQYFPDGNGTAEASIYFNRSNGTGGGVTSGAEISFHTTKNTYGPYGRETDEERVRITQRGELRLSANSLGIQFNGDTAAGNRLDDYEEGTFTPAVNSGTATTNWAKYTKIGDLVFIVCELTLTGTRSATVFEVSGLPFTNGPNWTPCSFYAQYYTDEGVQQASGVFRAGTDVFRVHEFGAESLATKFGNGYFAFAGTYKVH